MTIKTWLHARATMDLDTMKEENKNAPQHAIKSMFGEDGKSGMMLIWLNRVTTSPGISKYGEYEIQEAKFEKGWRGRTQVRFETLEGIFRFYGWGKFIIHGGRVSKSTTGR